MNREIDLVKKSYEELQDEVLKLTTDKFLLQTRWDSLREYCKEYADKDTMSSIIFGVVLDKMKALEGVDNDSNV